MTASLIDWRAEDADRWTREPIRLRHHLHEQPPFGRAALAALIDRIPPSASALVQTSRSEDGQRRWREGDRSGVSGEQVLQAIAAGSMWLNLREVNHHDAALDALLQQLYRELAAGVPGFDPQALKMGILISSPRIQVHYHVDLPGQALWQISGRKRVWVYPARPPYLSRESLEDIAYSGFEFKLPYEPGFDRAAAVLDLGPGEALTWPLNSPHRVDNLDTLNISVTTEHWTPSNRRSQQLSLANGVLRHRLGMARPSSHTQGPGFWAKWALQAAWRRSPWSDRTQQRERPITFRLDPNRPGEVIELANPR